MTSAPDEPAAVPPPPTGDEVADLRRRLEAAEARATAAEQESDRLRADLDSVLEAVEAAEVSTDLFDGPATSQPTLAADGSDPGVLPIALAGTAVVAGLAALVLVTAGRALSPVTLLMVAMTAGLAYAAYATRVNRIEIDISAGGIVYVERSRDGALRFDLGNEKTRVIMGGRPGEDDWDITFINRGGDEFTVNAGMVDAESFTARIRAFRPEI